jgi:hypothetical protein
VLGTHLEHTLPSDGAGAGAVAGAGTSSGGASTMDKLTGGKAKSRGAGTTTASHLTVSGGQPNTDGGVLRRRKKKEVRVQQQRQVQEQEQRATAAAVKWLEGTVLRTGERGIFPAVRFSSHLRFYRYYSTLQLDPELCHTTLNSATQH